MTWQKLIAALNLFAPPCCQPAVEEPSISLLAFRLDSGFGLPLVGAFLSDSRSDFSLDSTFEVDESEAVQRIGIPTGDDTSPNR